MKKWLDDETNVVANAFISLLVRWDILKFWHSSQIIVVL